MTGELALRFTIFSCMGFNPYQVFITVGYHISNLETAVDLFNQMDGAVDQPVQVLFKPQNIFFSLKRSSKLMIYQSFCSFAKSWEQFCCTKAVLKQGQEQRLLAGLGPILQFFNPKSVLSHSQN